MAAGENSYFESDGKALHVALTATVAKSRVVVVESWLGIAANDGVSGDTIAMTVDGREYQFEVPAALAVAKGAVVYIDIADLTGHYPDDAAWNTDGTGTTPIRLFKATMAKDANDFVTGIMFKDQL